MRNLNYRNEELQKIFELRFNIEPSGQVYKVYKIMIFEGVRKSMKSISKARPPPRRDSHMERTGAGYSS